jgi:hypothetical protein
MSFYWNKGTRTVRGSLKLITLKYRLVLTLMPNESRD